MGVYFWVDIPLITTPGIYHNSDLGLISLSSDGSTWITIADKNLGATQVYNSGDTLSEANCGKYYQRGNNYGFPFTGTVTNSSTQVNASTYGPGNYYSSSTFITTSTSPYDRSSVQNDNLWGGTTDTNVARKGPCDTGYHIPSQSEATNIVNALVSLGVEYYSQGGIYLKLPLTGYRARVNSGGAYYQGEEAHYWTSTAKTDGNRGYRFSWDSSSSRIWVEDGVKSAGRSIRPFKNEAVQPDNTWIVLYQPS